MTTSPVCPQERFAFISSVARPLLCSERIGPLVTLQYLLLCPFLLSCRLYQEKSLKSYLSVLAVISLPKSLAITFCSSLGSTLLLIENAAIDPLRLWVIKYRFLAPLPGSVALLVSEAGKEVFIFLFLVLLLLLLSLWTPLLLDRCSWGTAPQLR